MLNVNMDALNKPIMDTTASLKQKCHYTIGIPFPRTSGVHFTTNGLIVTFGLPESLSFIRNSIKSTSSDDKCQVELTNNNNNDTKKDWTPQSFSEYQTFIQRFSSANREYNDDMRRSFQNCIGNIIDSFARFEVDCKEQQRQQHQPHKKQKIITELIDKNRLSFKMNVEHNQNSMNSTDNDAEVKVNLAYMLYCYFSRKILLLLVNHYVIFLYSRLHVLYNISFIIYSLRFGVYYRMIDVRNFNSRRFQFLSYVG